MLKLPALLPLPGLIVKYSLEKYLLRPYKIIQPFSRCLLSSRIIAKTCLNNTPTSSSQTQSINICQLKPFQLSPNLQICRNIKILIFSWLPPTHHCMHGSLALKLNQANDMKCQLRNIILNWTLPHPDPPTHHQCRISQQPPSTQHFLIQQQY